MSAFRISFHADTARANTNKDSISGFRADFRELAVALAVGSLISIGVLGCNTFNAQNRNGYPNQAHAINASARPGGSISPAGSTSVSHGSSQTFIATASTGYQVADILVDGQPVRAVPYLYRDDSSSYTFDKVVGNHVISVLFAMNERR